MSRTFALRNELSAELERESDRGCAILAVCFLEECLRCVFASVLPHGEAAAKHFVPRGRLSVGVGSAHKLGLINNSLHETFKLLIEIRNTFAHGVPSELTFESPIIASKVKKLVIPDTSDLPEVHAFYSETSRRYYMFAVDNLFFTLEYIADHLKPLKAIELPVFKVFRDSDWPPNKSLERTREE